MMTVLIAPNPTNGIFTIQSPEKISTVEILNVLGEKIYSAHINSNQVEIDLRKQPKGIYFIEVQNGEKHLLKKMILL